jgi:hypothetical protein
VALACRVLAQTDDQLAYRLPSTYWPEHYELEVRPDFYPPLSSENFFFDGWITIHLRCVAPTDFIYLHYRQLAIDDSSIFVSEEITGSINVRNVSIDALHEFYIIQLERQVVADEHIRVSLNFTGPLRKDSIGLYWSEYMEGGTTRQYL